MGPCTRPLTMELPGGTPPMAPVVVTCGGCGVRIRILNPGSSKPRRCPRCSASLTPPVEPEGPPDLAGDPGAPAASSRTVVHASVIVLAVFGGLAIGWRATAGGRPGPGSPGT